MAERILCIIGKLCSGGVESVMYSYYRGLDKEKYQYDFVFHEGSPIEDIPHELKDMGARSFKVPPVSKPIKYMSEIKRIIKREGYKIVHSNMNTLSLFSLYVAKTCGVKYRILHNHSTSSGVEKKRDLIKRVLRPFNLLMTNKPCACSELAAKWMYGERAVEEGKIKVFRNGVDTERFRFNADYRDEIRKEFKVENKRVIGHVGRFMTQKNHLFVIDIFEKYSQRDEDAVLMLVGSGELQAEVKAYVAKKKLSDKVIFTGVRKDVEKLFCAFDVFILPSLYEGLPVVGMEACASGLPLLLADTITRECAVTDSVEFIPIDDAEVWAERIAESFGKDRYSISEQMVNGPYNIKNCVKELENYYDECK